MEQSVRNFSTVTRCHNVFLFFVLFVYVQFIRVRSYHADALGDDKLIYSGMLTQSRSSNVILNYSVASAL